MTDEKRKFRRRKLFLTLFHIIFVAMSVFGISAMYLNSNYGKGVKWIYEDAYEDSPQFDKQLTEDIDRIFTYVGYKDMFETDGKLDMHKVIVRVSNGPGSRGRSGLWTGLCATSRPGDIIWMRISNWPARLFPWTMTRKR